MYISGIRKAAPIAAGIIVLAASAVQAAPKSFLEIYEESAKRQESLKGPKAKTWKSKDDDANLRVGTFKERMEKRKAKDAVIQKKATEKALRKLQLKAKLDGFHIGKMRDIELYRNRLEAWIAMQEEYSTVELQKMPLTLPKGLKIISEVRAPTTMQRAEDNIQKLQFLRERGYNGVHVVFRENTDANVLGMLLSKLREDGWWVLLSFGPGEQEETRGYIDPKTLKSLLFAALPYAHAVAPVWRGNSLPHYAGDPMLYYHTVSCAVREIRPDVPLLGEYVFDHHRRNFHKILPEYTSGLMVLNVGMLGLNLSGIKTILDKDTDLPLIGMVVGPAVYWSSYKKWNENRKEVWRIKDMIERRFLGSGYDATMTLVGDGADGRFKVHDTVHSVDWEKELSK